MRPLIPLIGNKHMSAKVKTPEAIDVGGVAAEQGSSSKTKVNDPASVVLKGATASAPLEPGAPGAEVKTDDQPALAVNTIPSAEAVPDEKVSAPKAKPDDQRAALQATPPTSLVLAGDHSSQKPRSEDQASVASATSPSAATIRAEHSASPKANAVDQAATDLAAVLPAATVLDEKIYTPAENVFRTTTINTEELVSLGQANYEALLKAGQIWAAGLQDLAGQVVANAQVSLDETLAAFAALSSAKSPHEALDVQTRLAHAALEKALAESSRLTEASVKLLEQTLAPLTARATQTLETFGKRIA
jgi:phasin family protein